MNLVCVCVCGHTVKCRSVFLTVGCSKKGFKVIGLGIVRSNQRLYVTVLDAESGTCSKNQLIDSEFATSQFTQKSVPQMINVLNHQFIALMGTFPTFQFPSALRKLNDSVDSDLLDLSSDYQFWLSVLQLR